MDKNSELAPRNEIDSQLTWGLMHRKSVDVAGDRVMMIKAWNDPRISAMSECIIPKGRESC